MPNQDNVGTLEACQRLQAGGIMTDEDKKLLTEFLGECWHGEVDGHTCSCDMKFYYKKQLLDHIQNDNKNRQRSFTTWQDMGDLKEKLVEKGRYEGEYGFARFAHDKWYTQFHTIFKSYDGWLLNPAVFIPLVAEFLRREKD